MNPSATARICDEQKRRATVTWRAFLYVTCESLPAEPDRADRSATAAAVIIGAAVIAVPTTISIVAVCAITTVGFPAVLAVVTGAAANLLAHRCFLSAYLARLCNR